jgi:hypothetical protein
MMDGWLLNGARVFVAIDITYNKLIVNIYKTEPDISSLIVVDWYLSNLEKN